MRRKRITWSMAAALGLVAPVAWAQMPADRAPAVAGAEAEAGAPAPDDLDWLDLLLAADHGPGHGPAGRQGRGPGGRMGSRRGPRPMAGLDEELKLTEAQTSMLADIRDKRLRAAIPVESDLRIASLDLRKLLRAEKPDRRAIDAQIDRIAALRATLEKGRVAARLEARAVLTPEQQKLLREQRGGMTGRHPHGGPGMRRHGGPGMWMRERAGGRPRDI